MTATDRAMAREEWAHMDAKDARIRELEAEIERLKGEPLTAAATAYWHGKVHGLRVENERLRDAGRRALRLLPTEKPEQGGDPAWLAEDKRVIRAAFAPATDEIQPTEEER